MGFGPQFDSKIWAGKVKEDTLPPLSNYCPAALAKGTFSLMLRGTGVILGSSLAWLCTLLKNEQAASVHYPWVNTAKKIHIIMEVHSVCAAYFNWICAVFKKDTRAPGKRELIMTGLVFVWFCFYISMTCDYCCRRYSTFCSSSW